MTTRNQGDHRAHAQALEAPSLKTRLTPSFSQQIFTEHLLCVRPCPDSRATEMKKTDALREPTQSWGPGRAGAGSKQQTQRELV